MVLKVLKKYIFCQHGVVPTNFAVNFRQNRWGLKRRKVDAPISDCLRDCAPSLVEYKVMQICFPCRADRNQEKCALFGNFIPCLEIIVDCWNQKLARTYYRYLEAIITVHLNHSLLFTWAFKTIVENMVKKNRSCFPIAVLLTTLVCFLGLPTEILRIRRLLIYR
jgi:hypothetical protein